MKTITLVYNEYVEYHLQLINLKHYLIKSVVFEILHKINEKCNTICYFILNRQVIFSYSFIDNRFGLFILKFMTKNITSNLNIKIMIKSLIYF